jgi:alginate O-acetyltransferase complex protein AlgI
LVTYILVNLAWVFFRAKSLSAALTMLRSMAGLQANSTALLPTVKILETLVCIVGILAAQWYMRHRSLEDFVTQSSPRLLATAWACMAFAIIITQGRGDAFIYFQF